MARCAADTCGRWRPGVLARRMTGVQIDGRWFCSHECVERMARRLLLDARPRAGGVAPVPPLKLGVLLRYHGAITSEQLSRALEAQRESGLPLGAQLRATGLADCDTVLRGLASQAGVRYLATIDTSAVNDAPGGLPRDAVRALGLVPFTEPDRAGHIRVACAAPVPRAALAALRRLTGWSPEPYLVSDEVFAALLDAYASSRPHGGGAVTEFVRASTLSDAARRIATAASTSRRPTVTEAHWAPYTWVRVQAEGIVRDVLLDNEGEPCLAASTSH